MEELFTEVYDGPATIRDDRFGAFSLRAPLSTVPVSFAPASVLSPSLSFVRHAPDLGLEEDAPSSLLLQARSGRTMARLLAVVVGVAAIAFGVGRVNQVSAAVPSAAAGVNGAAPAVWNAAGTVEADRHAVLSAHGAGIVAKMNVKVGSSVNAGDVIAEVNGATTSTVRAPFDGVISAVLTQDGASVAANDWMPVADIADPTHQRLRFSLVGDLETQVHAGDRVVVTDDEDPRRTKTLTVARIVPPLNARAALAEIDLDEPTFGLADHVHMRPTY